MDANFHKDDPRRPPQWRAERATYLAHHSPRPLSPSPQDDDYVGAYCNLLIDLRRSDEQGIECDPPSITQPLVHQVHMFRVYPDREWEEMLQASLLSGETRNEIADRIGTCAEVVEYYEKLFLDVLDRLDDADYAREVILGPRELLLAGWEGVMSDGQRAFLYRLFAFYGGPRLLDFVFPILGVAIRLADDEKGAARLATAANRIMRYWAAANANNARFDKDAIVQLLELALSTQPQAKSHQPSGKEHQNHFERFAGRMLTQLTVRRVPGGRTATTKRYSRRGAKSSAWPCR